MIQQGRTTNTSAKNIPVKETTRPRTIASRRFIERYIGRDSNETGDVASERPDQLSHEGIRVGKGLRPYCGGSGQVDNTHRRQLAS